MDKVQWAVERFKGGLNCTQVVFGSHCEQFGLDKESAFKIATGFGGGMRMGETCGAVTGAFMVLGLKYGNVSGEDQENKAKAYEKIIEFTERFKSRNDSVRCKDLIGCDISTPEGYSKAQEEGVFDSICPKLVEEAINILEEMLA